MFRLGVRPVTTVDERSPGPLSSGRMAASLPHQTGDHRFTAGSELDHVARPVHSTAMPSRDGPGDRTGSDDDHRDLPARPWPDARSGAHHARSVPRAERAHHGAGCARLISGVPPMWTRLPLMGTAQGGPAGADAAPPADSSVLSRRGGRAVLVCTAGRDPYQSPRARPRSRPATTETQMRNVGDTPAPSRPRRLAIPGTVRPAQQRRPSPRIAAADRAGRDR